MLLFHLDVSFFFGRRDTSDGAWLILLMVRDMPLRAQDASRVGSGFGKDRRVAVRINVSTRDLDDRRRHCGFFWRCTVNSLNGAFDCKDSVLFFAHGNILAEEAVPAAV
ncbi:putative surface protease GP63 [Trypanosoma cruzi]|nr:putative surface protease GP63 [Trypanosoma cruzi]